MKIIQILFSYDRPIQLEGLCKSVLKNTDLIPSQLACICRSSSSAYRHAYDAIHQRLGVRIIHENWILPGINLRTIADGLQERHPLSRRLYSLVKRATTPRSLQDQMLDLAAEADYVSLAVDDMVYYQPASFRHAAQVLAENPEICVWSWRIGADLQPHPDMEMHNDYWAIKHAGLPIPYGYIFHTDGSLYRRDDLIMWLSKLPKAPTLNYIESFLSKAYKANPAAFPVGKLHAGPMSQACITWQINKVTMATGGRHFNASEETSANRLLTRFEQGVQLDYEPLYGSTAWIKTLNADYPIDSWTHLAPTAESVVLWQSLLHA